MKSFHGTVIEDQQELSPACILKSERQQQTFPSLTAESAVDGTPIPWTGAVDPFLRVDLAVVPSAWTGEQGVSSLIRPRSDARDFLQPR